MKKITVYVLLILCSLGLFTIIGFGLNQIPEKYYDYFFNGVCTVATLSLSIGLLYIIFKEATD